MPPPCIDSPLGATLAVPQDVPAMLRSYLHLLPSPSPQPRRLVSLFGFSTLTTYVRHPLLLTSAFSLLCVCVCGIHVPARVNHGCHSSGAIDPVFCFCLFFPQTCRWPVRLGSLASTPRDLTVCITSVGITRTCHHAGVLHEN